MELYVVIEHGGAGWGEDNYTTIHLISDNKTLAEDTAIDIQKRIDQEEQDYLTKDVTIEIYELNKLKY